MQADTATKTRTSRCSGCLPAGQQGHTGQTQPAPCLTPYATRPPVRAGGGGAGESRRDREAVYVMVAESYLFVKNLNATS